MKRVKIVKTPAGYRSPDGKMHQTVNDAALHCSGGRKYNISPRKPVKMTFDDDDKMNDEKMNDDDDNDAAAAEEPMPDRPTR